MILYWWFRNPVNLTWVEVGSWNLPIIYQVLNPCQFWKYPNPKIGKGWYSNHPGPQVYPWDVSHSLRGRPGRWIARMHQLGQPFPKHVCTSLGAEGFIPKMVWFFLVWICFFWDECLNVAGSRVESLKNKHDEVAYPHTYIHTYILGKFSQRSTLARP